jgi:hypothetical protein
LARAAAEAPLPTADEAIASEFEVVSDMGDFDVTPVPLEEAPAEGAAADVAAADAEADEVAPEDMEPSAFEIDEVEATTVIHADAEAASFQPEETHVLAVPEEQPTLIGRAEEASHFFEDETVTGFPAAIPSMPLSAPPEAVNPPEEGETVIVAPPPPPVEVRPSMPSPPPSPPRPPAPMATPPAPVPPLRLRPLEPAPRAERAPRPAAPPPAARPAPPPPKSSTPVGLYAGLAVVALLVLGGGAFAVWQFVLKPKPGGGTTADSVPVAPTPVPVVTTLAPTTMAAATHEPTPEATPAVEEAMTVVKPTPAPAASPKVADKTPLTAPPLPGVKPTPAGRPTPAGAKPTPATAPVGPAPEALRAQQVADLVGQADGALAAQKYDAAAALYDEALKLDPGSERARSGKTSALAGAAVFKKSFVPGRTSVQSGKAAKGSISGFDSEDVSVAKAPDYSGRIEFEANPAHVKPGDNYSVKVFLVNDGKKAFKIGGLNIGTVVNGARSGGGTVSAPTSEVGTQQRVLLQEVPGVWPESVNSWALEVVVTSNRGDTFKNQLTWR